MISLCYISAVSYNIELKIFTKQINSYLLTSRGPHSVKAGSCGGQCVIEPSSTKLENVLSHSLTLLKKPLVLLISSNNILLITLFN